MKKNNKKQLIKDLKQFLKMYLFSLTASLVTVSLIDMYSYKDNIYYHHELKLSDKEVEEMENLVSTTIGEEITINDNSIVLDAAIENKSLTEEEKQTVYKFKDLLDDNPYLDKTNAYDNLQKLNIIYDEDADRDDNVLGFYVNTDDEITIIQDNDKKETMLHELVHCIYSNNYIPKLPKFFNEGMTELLTNEYFEENPFIEKVSYPYEILMVKILCEIVGEDKVLESYSKGDIKILEEELGKKTGLSEPHELIENMESVSNSLENRKEIDKQAVTNIIETLKRYYNENYEFDSIEYEMYLYNKEHLEKLYEKDPITSYQINLMLDGYYVKPYFSTKLKEKFPNPFHAEYYQDIYGRDDYKVIIKSRKNKEKESI